MLNTRVPFPVLNAIRGIKKAKIIVEIATILFIKCHKKFPDTVGSYMGLRQFLGASFLEEFSHARERCSHSVIS